MWKKLNLIENECNEHYHHILIICPTVRWHWTYYAKGWIRHDGNIWLIRPKDSLYQWIEKFLPYLAGSETLLHFDDTKGFTILIKIGLSQVSIVDIISGCLQNLGTLNKEHTF